MPTLTRGGERIGWDDVGDLHGEPAIVCVHNLMMDRAIYAPLAEALGARHRLLLVDVRGHGESSAKAPFTIGDLADDVGAIIDASGCSDAVLVGTSIGSAAVIEAALRRPAQVRALVLTSACAAAATRVEAVKTAVLAQAVATFGAGGEIGERALGATLGATFRGESPAIVAAWRARLATRRGAELAEALRAWGRRPSFEARLGAIRAPTLVMTGTEDTATPLVEGRDVAARVPCAAFVAIAGAGHTPALERPDAVVAEIRRFLGEVSGRAGAAG